MVLKGIGFFFAIIAIWGQCPLAEGIRVITIDNGE